MGDKDEQHAVGRTVCEVSGCGGGIFGPLVARHAGGVEAGLSDRLGCELADKADAPSRQHQETHPP